MILEVATLQVHEGKEAEFETVFAWASSAISKAKCYLGHELNRCLERKCHYVLLVRWESVDAHTVTFKASSEYEEFRRSIHPFYVKSPEALHYERVEGGLSESSRSTRR